MKSKDINITEINTANLEIFYNLGQAYEAEFSNLTYKMPNELGVFKIDTQPTSPYIGYLLYFQGIPVGFCVADVENKIKHIAEFYIAPVMRKKNLGYKLATTIFNKYPGEWMVQQIQGSINAIGFWRNTIGKYTKNKYTESVVPDALWGKVTRQRFTVNLV